MRNASNAECGVPQKVFRELGLLTNKLNNRGRVMEAASENLAIGGVRNENQDDVPRHSNIRLWDRGVAGHSAKGRAKAPLADRVRQFCLTRYCWNFKRFVEPFSSILSFAF
jgi:hypothetical protein